MVDGSRAFPPIHNTESVIKLYAHYIQKGLEQTAACVDCQGYD